MLFDVKRDECVLQYRKDNPKCKYCKYQGEVLINCIAKKSLCFPGEAKRCKMYRATNA